MTALEPLEAVIFDLDMTLVDTSALKPFVRMWGQYRSHLDEARPFVTAGRRAPHELPAAVRARGLKVGVATSLPEYYATRHLGRFGICYDALVAYHDTREHKPHPAPIIRVCRDLGVAPENCCYVGNDAADMEAAYRAGVSSVGVAWGVSRYKDLCEMAPDILVGGPDDLLEILPQFSQAGYLGEVFADGATPYSHLGSLLRCGLRPKAFALGRYFNLGKDPRHGGHALSRLLLELKRGDDAAAPLGRALRTLFEAATDWKPDFITAVPPKPGATRNRMRAVLAEAASTISGGTVLDLEGLRCAGNPEEYKSKGPQSRAEAVKGIYESRRSWSGRVLLVDDILTTGATGRECESVLRASGAEDFILLALGKAQRPPGPKFAQQEQDELPF